MKNDERRYISFSMMVDSETRVIGDIISSLELLCPLFDFDENMVKVTIPLVIDELLRNAIKHGNKNDKSKVIKIDIYLDNSRFKLAVEDEGDGFDYGKYLEKSVDVGKFAGSGRGLLMVINYAEKIDFNKKGNRIKVELVSFR